MKCSFVTAEFFRAVPMIVFAPAVVNGKGGIPGANSSTNMRTKVREKMTKERPVFE